MTLNGHPFAYAATLAQQLIDQHHMSFEHGLCVVCYRSWPCVKVVDAQERLARYGLLPQRTPGATRPDLAGLRRVR